MPNQFLYNKKPIILTPIEQKFKDAIDKALPEGYILLVQQSLSQIVERTDNPRFINELFRVVDFLVVDKRYQPLFCIEINDATHEDYNRRQRDQKVHDILEEAGIPLVTFWVKYGINQDYIDKRITDTLNFLPIERVHHFNKNSNRTKQQKGCYIATCVYNSYDCPEVWTLRRFRDDFLEKHFLGRMFIKCYYFISPKIVNILGDFSLFRKPCKIMLDKFVKFLNKKGFKNNKYND